MQTQNARMRTLLAMFATVCLGWYGFAFSQCLDSPSETAQSFLREFEKAPNPGTLRSVYDHYISQERRFTFEQLEKLKTEVVKRFGARPEGVFREPELLGDKPFTAGRVSGAEVALVASYPEGRVMQITRVVCEGDSWKVHGFEFRPRK